MTIKEARTIARMTQKEVEEEFGVPSRTLQNWEAGIRDCPEYVEKWLIEKLIQCVRIARIKTTGDEIIIELWNADVQDFDFSRSFKVDEKNRVSFDLLDEIRILVENGWKVYFI